MVGFRPERTDLIRVRFNTEPDYMRAYTQFYSRLKGGGTKPEELCMSMKKEEDNFCVEPTTTSSLDSQGPTV